MGTKYYNAMKAEILEMTGNHVDQLHALWVGIFEPKTCDEFVHRLKDHAQTFYTDLLNESREKQQTILDEIAGLRAEASDLTRLLHETVDIGERPEDVPLVLWLLQLDKSIKHQREELSRRRTEISELLFQQEQLCAELEEVPLSLQEDPLPLPQEMDAFRDHLEQLRDRRVQRLKEMDQLRHSIKTNMKTLGIFSISDSEAHLLSQDNQCHNPEALRQLRRMQTEFAHQIQQLHEQIDDMRLKIEVLWSRLPQTDDFAKRRVREATAYTQYTYDVLLEELQRCQALRSKNLKTFIEQLRVEIKEWWDLTLKSPQERQRFASYFSDYESEDVLELHETELDSLKDFYSANKKIFELYANRAEQWSRLEALEAKANDPNRFNNRGGQLLKEERERKAISVKLPKIEQQITELVNAYVGQMNTPFLVFGEDILRSMALDWEQLRQPKQQPSARKKQENSGAVRKIIPPAAPPLATQSQKSKTGLSGSSSTLKKTPSRVDVSQTAKSTDNLLKRRRPNLAGNATSPTAAAVKRNIISSLDCSTSSIVLAVNAQRIVLKPTKKKVCVLDHALRRGKRTGRPSAGNRKRPVPQIRIQAPSGEENESGDSDGLEPRLP